MPCRARGAGGFTLAEVVLASAVLMFVVAAFSHAIVAGQQKAHAAVNESRATSLLDALMAEIMTKPYAPGLLDGDIGPEVGETRSTFDAIDDYHGHSETPGALMDATGTAYPPSYDRFVRSVSIEEADDFVEVYKRYYSGLRIIITVTDGPRTWTIERYVPEPED
jgi:MSHA pilin protein MshD